MKILQLYYKLPFPAHDGGALSIRELTNALLSDGMDVRVLAMKQKNEPFMRNEDFEIFSNTTRLQWIEVDNRVRLKDVIRSLFDSRSYLSSRFDNKSFGNALIHILQEEMFDVVMLDHLYLHWYIIQIRKNSKARIVLRAQNAEGDLWNQNVKAERNPIKKMLLSIMTRRLIHEEQQVLRAVNLTLTTSELDKQLLLSRCPQVQIETVRIPVSRRIIQREFSEIQRSVTFYHIGSMDWLPNARGMKWFFDYVYPLLLKDSKMPKIYLAGKNMPEWMYQFDDGNNGIKIVGEVESSFEFHMNHDILLVPVQQSGGVRVKILEAMMAGNAVISTAAGAQGLDMENGKHLLIADSARDFACCMQKLIYDIDLRKQLVDNAKSAVTARNSHNQVAVSFREVIANSN